MSQLGEQDKSFHTNTTRGEWLDSADFDKFVKNQSSLSINSHHNAETQVQNLLLHDSRFNISDPIPEIVKKM